MEKSGILRLSVTRREKNTLSNIMPYLKGSDELSAEHQFFNITCLFGVVYYLFFIIINIIFNIDFSLTLVKLFGAVASFTLYYFSRIKGRFSWWISFLFFVLALFTFIYLGMKSGGVTGAIAPIYTAILALILFITDGWNRLALVLIWFLSITALFFLEYYNPDMIIIYTNAREKYIDLYLGYASGIVVIAFVVSTVKKLYKKEKMSLEEHREKSNEFEERVTNNIKRLTISEREICLLLIDGMSNQKIADDRHVVTGTVKTHVNHIYKKLEVKNRKELINVYREFKDYC